MNINELYLKTAFCCMACDGDIANEEVQLIKDYTKKSDLFVNLDVEKLLNEYINSINTTSGAFLNSYLSGLKNFELTDEQQLRLIEIAIEMIEADNQVLYSEVKFFKKIRFRLPISDDAILEKHPDKEDFLLPDTNVDSDFEWGDITFATISLDEIKN